MNAPAPLAALRRDTRPLAARMAEASALEAEHDCTRQTLLARDAILSLPQYLHEPDVIVLLYAVAQLIERDPNLRQMVRSMAGALHDQVVAVDDIWHDGADS